ncbi:hypothetical protein B0H66DRAFT_95122 [Apodospora peruviana]|uniref:NAD(P)-binding protein n=1 Tax=Apodospora peruviana TaxID=516989 RepID=A0AAE0IUB7_9PEZI|nr:hypothetical protein B0H66DRAFT_95122 [Apodospora peruviana]
MAALIWHPIRRLLFGLPGKPSISFDPARDIPSLADKVILITGGAGDLGKQLAIEYARHGPARIYIADLPCDDGGEAVIKEIRDGAPGCGDIVRFLAIDLSSLESVRKAAAEVTAAEDRLDILVLNAGVVLMKPDVTQDGYEMTWSINFLGHALLTKLLMPTLLQTAASTPEADVRVLAVSSEGHAMAPKGGIFFDKLKTGCSDLTYVQRYAQSKLAIIGYARELAARHPQIKVVSVHPGRILTGLFRRLQKDNLLFKYTAPITPFFCTTVENGVKNHLWVSTAPAADVVSGTYYEPVGITGKESALARDEKLSGRLWEWTEAELARWT